MSPPGTTLLDSRFTVLHIDARAAYSLLHWQTPPGASSPPLHRHRRTDEGLYVLAGRLGLLVEGEQSEHQPGAFALIGRGQRHTFWNPGDEPAVFLALISPAGLEDYFAELAPGLDHAASDEDAAGLRDELSTRHDVEIVGPPPRLPRAIMSGAPTAAAATEWHRMARHASSACARS